MRTAAPPPPTRRGALARLALLVLAATPPGRAHAADAPPPARVGQPAPAFRLARLDDPAREFLPQHLRGQVWVLNLWASWCVPCREELPALKGLSAHVPIVGVNYKDSRQKGLDWLARHGNPYQVTAHDAQGQVGLAYGVVGVPETIVIDRRGVVRFRHTGPVTDEMVRDELLPLIRKLQRGLKA